VRTFDFFSKKLKKSGVSETDFMSVAMNGKFSWGHKNPLHKKLNLIAKL